LRPQRKGTGDKHMLNDKNLEVVPVENVVSDTKIEDLIHYVHGEQVMLDSDLAMLYNVETKRLNETVKRNAKRFPENFCFQLSEKEYDSLRSQFATSNVDENISTKGGRRYLPYAFTEQGIAMLSAVLRSDAAIQVSLNIMNTFVKMRRFLAENALMFDKLNRLEVKQLEYQRESNEKFDRIFAYLSDHEESEQKIFFDGQIYDAFSLFTSLIQKADRQIVLIDGYVDLNTLNILAKKKPDVAVTVYAFERGNRLTEQDIEKFNAQYRNLEVKYTKAFHDRFMIIDGDIGYHIGASLKDAGSKCFAISHIQDEGIVHDILQRLAIETEE